MMKTKFKSERVNPGPGLALVPEDGSPEPQAKPQFSVKTLSELGPNLPVGISVAGGPRVRPFRVRPYKMKQEKALAKLRDELKGPGALGRFVVEALSMMVQTIGPHNFDAMKDNERQLVINQMIMPDVLYLYLYLRYSALGDEPVVMQIKCPNCAEMYRWYGDLGSMDVKIVDDDKMDLTRAYELRDSFQLRGKECKILKLAPIKWDAFGRPEFHQKGSMSNAMISSSIVGVDAFDIQTGTFIVTGTDLDDMTKYDMSGLTADIEQNTPGPQLDVEPECPACSHKQRMMMDWSWDNFFARSARPNH